MTVHKGIDVSSFQGPVDAQAVHGAGRRFEIIKRSEGADVLDSRALDNQKNGRRANLHTGFYHFLHPRPGRSGKVEAEFFYKHVEGVKAGPGDGARLLWLALDIEVTHFTGSAADVRKRTLDYSHAAMARLQEIAGHTPVLYTFPAFFADWGQRFAEYPLWIAHPGVSHPTLPAPWHRYAIWQDNFKGRVPGVHGLVDTDLCPTLSPLILDRNEY